MVKIGLIGCGEWGKNHLRVLKGLNCQIVGVFDKNRSKAAIANKYQVKFFKNRQELFKKAEAVLIVTPPATHFFLAKEALKQNKHVFVEKPFTAKVFQAKRLVCLAKKNQKIVMVGHIFMYSPAFQFIKKIVQSGGLGDIYYLYARRVNFGTLRSDVNALENFAPHDLSIIIQLVGKPKTIRAIGKDIIQNKIEDIAFLHLEFSKNITASIHVSWLDPLKQRQLIIVGSKKMIFWDDTNPDKPVAIHDKSFTVSEKWHRLKSWKTFQEFKVKTKVGKTTYPKISKKEPLKSELEHFLECIRKDKQPISDGQQGLIITQLIDKANQSLRKNGKIMKVHLNY